MMENTTYLIHNATIVNEGDRRVASVLIENEIITKISDNIQPNDSMTVINADGCYLLPGVIDTHVHFRDPGLTNKADFATESSAAVAGGVTSVVDMPNTKPQTTSKQLLDYKKQIAAEKSLVNYGFMLGATNDNIEDLLAIDKTEYAAIKLFLGSSTGNMLVNNDEVLDKLFAEASKLIVAHCEDEDTIVANTQRYRDMYGDNAPAAVHAMIRDVDACYRSSKKAVELARKFGTRFHLAHLSTRKELDLLSIGGVEAKNVTAEVSPNHLWFSDEDYVTLGNKIRCNPSIKSAGDRDALLQALKEGKIDTVATDHAPHLIEEKERPYFQSVSGMPSIQHSLLTMLELSKQGKISLEAVVEKMSHNPAILFGIERRGFICKGYYADLVLVNSNETTAVDKPSLLYKCGWSPMEGYVFTNKIVKTFVNGNLVYNDGVVNGTAKGMPLSFTN